MKKPLFPVAMALLLMAPIPLLAAAPRGVDMTAVLLDENGKPLKDTYEGTPADPRCEKCGPLTLGHAVAHAAFAQFCTTPQMPCPTGEKEVTAEERFKRSMLALRIENDKAAVLSAEEVALCKKLLGYVYSGIVLARAWPMLDPSLAAAQK